MLPCGRTSFPKEVKMKGFSRLFLAVLLLVVALLSQPPKAYALTCSDCISICLLNRCGFVSNPPCEAANYNYCRYQRCASSCK
jgi:hypothetical protein